MGNSTDQLQLYINRDYYRGLGVRYIYKTAQEILYCILFNFTNDRLFGLVMMLFKI